MEETASDLLRIVIKQVSPYRFLNRAIVRIALDELLADETHATFVSESLEKLGWQEAQVNRAINKCCLVSKSFHPSLVHETEIEIALRRIIFFDHFRSPDEQLQAHRAALASYETFWAAGDKRREIYFERYWHSLEILRLDESISAEEGRLLLISLFHEYHRSDPESAGFIINGLFHSDHLYSEEVRRAERDVGVAKGISVEFFEELHQLKNIQAA